MPKVYLIDDDVELRRSVEALLLANGFQFASYSSVEDFLAAQPEERQAGVILLDFLLSGRDGLSFLKLHRERADSMPVIVLTGNADVNVAVNFVKAGASMLLLKPYEPRELLSCIRQALDWDSRLLARTRHSKHVEACRSQLTSRQISVLEAMLTGAANKVIASQLSVSERTIEADRSEIIKRFGAKNAVDLAVMITESRRELEPLAFRLESNESASIAPSPVTAAPTTHLHAVPSSEPVVPKNPA